MSRTIRRAIYGLLVLFATFGATAHAQEADCPPLLRYTFNQLQTGQAQSLCRFRGKVLLIVNTASKCGYTPQYEGLEALYRKYKDRGLVVVGFPSNDFGGQEPGSNKQIAEFCRTTYGVTFPLFRKIEVNGDHANPLYKFLKAQAPVSVNEDIKWNFTKFLVGSNGKIVGRFESPTTPETLDPVIGNMLAN